MLHSPIMQSKVMADVYSGENCDEVTTYFNTYCSGDMSDDNHKDDIIITLKDLPPGTKITVEYPCCPDCGVIRDDKMEFLPGGIWKIVGHEDTCDCGFDWNNWVQNEFS